MNEIKYVISCSEKYITTLLHTSLKRMLGLASLANVMSPVHAGEAIPKAEYFSTLFKSKSMKTGRTVTLGEDL